MLSGSSIHLDFIAEPVQNHRGYNTLHSFKTQLIFFFFLNPYATFASSVYILVVKIVSDGLGNF